jgi:hypothetical protein
MSAVEGGDCLKMAKGKGRRVDGELHCIPRHLPSIIYPDGVQFTEIAGFADGFPGNAELQLGPEFEPSNAML